MCMRIPSVRGDVCRDPLPAGGTHPPAGRAVALMAGGAAPAVEPVLDRPGYPFALATTAQLASPA